MRCNSDRNEVFNPLVFQDPLKARVHIAEHEFVDERCNDGSFPCGASSGT